MPAWCSCIDFTEYRGHGPPATASLSRELSSLKQSPRRGGVSYIRGIIQYKKKQLFIKMYRLRELRMNNAYKANWQGILSQSIRLLYTHACPQGEELVECLLHLGISAPVLVCNCTLDREQAFLTAFPVLEGDMLSDMIAPASRRWLHREEARRAFCTLLQAVYRINTARLVHGDLNPSNILIGRGGTVYIIDTDGLTPRDIAETYGPPFVPGTSEETFSYLSFIKDRFETAGKIATYWKWIDYFMLVLDSLMIGVLVSRDDEIVEEFEDTCCWEEFLETEAARKVEEALGEPLVREHLAGIVQDSVRHVSYRNRVRDLYKKYYLRGGLCGGG